MKVSIFRNFNEVQENLELYIILEQIKVGKYKTQVQNLRELIQQGRVEEYNKKKKSLLAFTPSGLFEGGRKLEFLKEYSGYLILDLDDLNPDQLNLIKTKASEVSYTYSSFISPSGRGLKILVKVFSRPVFHKEAFNQVKQYYEQQIDFPIDPSGKDITRLCFVSWDELPYLNPTSTIFKPYINMVEEDIEKVVQQIEARRLDITTNYKDWIQIAFSLIDALGEESRDYFHRISKFNPAYLYNICNDQFNKCLTSTGHGITINTFFYLAKEKGIVITDHQTPPLRLERGMGGEAVQERRPGGEAAPPKPKKNRITTIQNYLNERYQFRYNTVTNQLEVLDLQEKQSCHCEEQLPEQQSCHCEDGQKQSEATTWQQLTDYLENSILIDLLKSNVKCSAAILRSILYSDFCPFFDPFKEYFHNLPPWENGTDHIRQLSETIKTTNDEQWHLFLKKWLVAAVASVLHPKTVNHTAIILSGPQGAGKTSWLLKLCPPELTDYIFSGTINPNNKDTFLHLSECMFINMDELENMNRTEIGTFKEIITKPAIRIRRAYGHHMEPLIRRASFMGSVNSSQFLSDSTGSRRFLCFETLEIDYKHKIDMRLVYSNAYGLYKQKFRFYFDQEEIKSITANNEQFQVQSLEEELLLTCFKNVPLSEATRFLSSAQILSRIAEISHVPIVTTPGAVIRLGKALRKFGFEKRKSDGLYIWAVKELPFSPR